MPVESTRSVNAGRPFASRRTCRSPSRTLFTEYGDGRSGSAGCSGGTSRGAGAGVLRVATGPPDASSPLESRRIAAPATITIATTATSPMTSTGSQGGRPRGGGAPPPGSAGGVGVGHGLPLSPSSSPEERLPSAGSWSAIRGSYLGPRTKICHNEAQICSARNAQAGAVPEYKELSQHGKDHRNRPRHDEQLHGRARGRGADGDRQRRGRSDDAVGRRVHRGR